MRTVCRGFTASALLIFSTTVISQALTEYPDGPRPLNEKWEWGLGQAADPARNSAWIAYQFNTELDEKIGIAISSFQNDYYQWNGYSYRGSWNGYRSYGNANARNDGNSIASLFAGNRSPQQLHLRQHELLVLARFSYGTLDEFRIVDASTPINWRNSPVFWLGAASAGESFRLLSEQLALDFADNVSRALIRGIGLHRDQDRTAFLSSLLNSRNWQAIRPAIIQSIAMQSSAAVEALLISAASDANEAQLVRRIAISALSRYDTPAALAALQDLSGMMNPQSVRRAAVASLAAFEADEVTQLLRTMVLLASNAVVSEQALRGLSLRPGQFDTIANVAGEHDDSRLRRAAVSMLAPMDRMRAFEPLKTIAESDQNFRVRREAVEAMQHLPAELAVPLLFALAESEQDQPIEVRREAVETLSEFDASLVAARLNQLAWSDGSRRIREEAVESLADLNDQSANSMLLEIARNHPSKHTSEEALHQLQDNVL